MEKGVSFCVCLCVCVFVKRYLSLQFFFFNIKKPNESIIMILLLTQHNCEKSLDSLTKLVVIFNYKIITTKNSST